MDIQIYRKRDKSVISAITLAGKEFIDSQMQSDGYSGHVIIDNEYIDGWRERMANAGLTVELAGRRE